MAAPNLSAPLRKLTKIMANPRSTVMRVSFGAVFRRIGARLGRRALVPAASLLCAACANPAAAPPPPPVGGVSAAQVHARLLTLDSHLDTPVHFDRPGWNFAQRHSFDDDRSQVDLPRMDDGLDGGFFVIYTRQGPLTPAGYAAALDFALKRGEAIRRTVAANPRRISFATRAADAAAIDRSGRRIAFQSIENSYPLGLDLANLRRFYDMGVRMAGPVHSRNNQFADSTTDTPRWNGLSPLGRNWVAEMNRLGMIVDGSHSSDAALDQMIALSKTPVILSHSGPRAIFDHKRNVTDAAMRKLAASGGVMMINSVFLVPFSSTPQVDALVDAKGGLDFQTPAEQAATLAKVRALHAGAEPYTSATFDQFMASLLHALKVMGPDHVGLGADWDGGGGTIGMMDVAALPQVTERLLAAGYSEADLRKIWSGNLLRLLAKAEAGRTAS
jgi:membrane dipeptidase